MLSLEHSNHQISYHFPLQTGWGSVTWGSLTQMSQLLRSILSRYPSPKQGSYCQDALRTRILMGS